MQIVFQPLQKELNQVINIIETELNSPECPFLNSMLQYTKQGHGKLLRPALAICSAHLKGEPPSKFYLQIAAALEILHTASLVHDDIIDQAELRRGVNSVCQQFGNGEAVLFGDWLLAKSFAMITTIDNINILKDSSRLFSELTEGQFLEMDFKKNNYITETSYLRMIDLKTSSIFRWACSGAVHCNSTFSNEEHQKLKTFGSCFGAIFQISDDLIDIKLTRQEAGKSTSHDLKNGLITLPVIKGLQIEALLGQDRLKSAINNHDNAFFQDGLTVYLEKIGALNACRQQSLNLYEQAMACLSAFPDSPHKKILTSCTKFALNQVS